MDRRSSRFFSVAILATSSALAGVPASAKTSATALEQCVAEQQREIDALKKQVETLIASQRSAAPAGTRETFPAGVAQDAPPEPNQPRGAISFIKGAPTFKSADGQFSAALHTLTQFDQAWYTQRKAPTATQLSNGSNFRRAQVALSGTAFRDWSYNITLDFGGSGIEKPGYIYYAYAQYDGLKPFGIRIGGFTPQLTLDDATGSGDLMFLERAAPVDVARNIAGGPSREGISVFAQGPRYLAAVSFTGGKVGDSALFEEQQAILGRASYLAYAKGDTRVLLDAGGTYVFKVPGTVAGARPPTALALSATPELTVDSTGTKLVATPSFDADHVKQWDVGTAVSWRSVLAQGGYFRYAVDRRASALANPQFAGWYAQAGWMLTGESRPYDPGTASFRNPQPRKPLGSAGGLGAWEIAARYSVLGLDDRAGAPGTPQPADAVRGGQQRIWTLGLNWYPNSIFHFALNYSFIDVRRLSVTGADIGVRADAITLRSQVGF